MIQPAANDPVLHLPRRWVRGGFVLVWVVLCAWPYLDLARHPSLFDDDFTRVGGLRRSPLWASLWQPFNEHLAPLFELVSRLAWWGSGENVALVAYPFLAASYLATLTTAVSLGLVVGLETGSTLGTLAALGLFCLESVAIETVLWFSASSFQWSAATSLLAWYSATNAIQARTGSNRRKWLLGASLLAGFSPLFSAIGVLAGPLASFRIALSGGLNRRSQWACVVAPLGGTLAFLALVAVNPGHGTALSASVRRHRDPLAALRTIVEAPGQILVPSMIGLPASPDRLPVWLAGLVTLSLIAGGIHWATRDPSRRGLIGTGLAWIGGGYTLAYLARAQAGDRWIMEVGRYHLLPLLGLIAGLGAGLGPLLDRLERRRPLAGWVALVMLTSVGSVVHGWTMRHVASRSFQFPGESRAIAAALRLEAICRHASIPLDQAIRIIDPIIPRWFPRPLPFHPLLYLFGSGPAVARWSDLEARAQILRSLTPEDRGLIFGGLDARPYLSSDDGKGGITEQSVAGSGRGEDLTPDSGRVFFVEFASPNLVGDPVEVGLRGVGRNDRVEIWWAGEGGGWSRERSIRLVGPTGSGWVMLTRLPHWQNGVARRWRLVRRAGPFAEPDRLALIFRGELVHSDH